MRFLVLVPRWVSVLHAFYAFPLGLSYISAVLKRAGYDVVCLNLNHIAGPISEVIRETIEKNAIDAVLTGGLSTQYAVLKAHLQAVRAARPEMVTVVGGGIISSLPEVMLGALGPTIGVIGEGEQTIVELADALINKKPLDAINGIIYKAEDGALRTTAPRAPIEDLDALPIPDYEGIGAGPYLDAMVPTDLYTLYTHDNPRMLPMIGSRSCPFSCTFCFHPLGNKYRQRSLDSIFKELDYIINKFRITMIEICDELFAASPARLDEFCRRIKPYGVNWLVQLRVTSADDAVLRQMRDAGCIVVGYGIESMSNEVLKSMQKKITSDQTERAIEMTFKNSLCAQGNLIFGDPAETWKTVDESMEWWLSHRHMHVNLSWIIPYPGTALFKDAVAKGTIKNELAYVENGCPGVNLMNLGEGDYYEIARMVNILNMTPVPESMGPVLKLEAQPDPHPMRGTRLVTIESVCPHCGAELVYRNLEVGQNPFGDMSVARMPCKVCNRRIDFPLTLIPVPEYPADVTVYLRQAIEHIKERRFQDALAPLQKIIERFPNHEDALSLLAHVLLTSGNFGPAIHYCTQCVRANPFKAEFHGMLASALAAAGRYLAAKAHIQTALGLQRIAREPHGELKLAMVAYHPATSLWERAQA